MEGVVLTVHIKSLVQLLFALPTVQMIIIKDSMNPTELKLAGLELEGTINLHIQELILQKKF